MKKFMRILGTTKGKRGAIKDYIIMCGCGNVFLHPANRDRVTSPCCGGYKSLRIIPRAADGHFKLYILISILEDILHNKELLPALMGMNDDLDKKIALLMKE